MNWFTNLKIGKKLGLAFGIVELFMIVLGIFSIVQLSKVNGSTVDLATNWLPSVRIVGELRFDAAAYRRDTLNFIIAAEDKKQHYQQNLGIHLSEIVQDERTYEPMINSDEKRKLYQGFRDQWDKYVAVNEHVMELAKQNKTSEAIVVTQSEGSQFFEAASKYLQEDVDLNNKGGDDAAKQAASAYSSSRYWVIGILIGTVVLGFGVAVSLARSIASATAGMLGMIQEVAANNLTVKRYGDQFQRRNWPGRHGAESDEKQSARRSSIDRRNLHSRRGRQRGALQH